MHPRIGGQRGTTAGKKTIGSDQQARGLTGSNIGIHGPERRAAWLGGFSVGVDWTQGCIAVGSDDEMAEISAFVTQHPLAAVNLTR